MEFKKIEGTWILRWNQEITLKKSEDFKKALASFLDKDGEWFILSLKDVAYINSAGLGAIAHSVISARKANKELVIVHIQPTVAEIFSIVKFQTFIKFFDTEKEAIEYFSKKEREAHAE
jgi:anti-sigma B factor antagonist